MSSGWERHLRGTYDSSSDLGFIALPINTGESPTDDYWPDGRTSKEKFVNLRGELWWKMRVRFEKAYESVNGIKQHPPDEMISIPNHPQLIAELSLPLRIFSSNGKIGLESKESMRKRGVASPNFADALVLAFADGNYGPWESASLDQAQRAADRAPRGVFQDEGESDWRQQWRG